MNIIKYKLELTDTLIPALTPESIYEYAAAPLDSAEAVGEMLEKCYRLKHLAEEHIVIIGLNSKLVPIATFEVAHGQASGCAVCPKDILTRALMSGATGIMIAHNHPTGNPTPSLQDRKFCDRLKGALNLIGIKLIDFIIIGDYIYSFARENQL